MADNATLSLTSAGVTSAQLDILVKNTGIELKRALLIELKIPLSLVSKKISDAVERARQRNLDERTTASKESLADIVTGATGWSVWATTERTDSLAVIRLVNDLSPTGAKLPTPVSFGAATQFNLRIPVIPQDKPFRIEVPYSYRYPNEGRSGQQTDGELEVVSSDAKATAKVTLTVDHPNPTMIKPETKLRLSWEVENGVSATLYGPLPGGNPKVSLSTKESGTYRMRKDSVEIYAVGSATYILQAEVRGTESNEMIVRTLYLGIQSADDYSFLAVRPKRVMPHGVLVVDWAVWGIEKTWLSVGNDYEIELKLTEQGISETYQGSGLWRVVAPEAEGTVTALLQSQVNNRRKDEKTDNFIVAAWRAKDISVSGDPVGLAVAAPTMALLTSDALWLAEVGVSDGQSTDLDFKKAASATTNTRLAIAAFDSAFVVLEQTKNDGLQLVRYSQTGQRGLAVDLPDTVRPLVRMAGRAFDLTVFDKRVYVAVEGLAPGGYRRVFSVIFNPQAKLQPEPLLDRFFGYRLLAFDNAIFALNQGTGHMFRFRQNANGKLEQPAETARAAKDGRSMVFSGLLVPLGRVLVVLGPTSIPQIESLDVDGPLRYSFTKRPTASMTQDLVYNPQQDHWMPCGRGLKIQESAVAALRSTSSKRLWVVESNKKAHTLSGAVEHLFSPEFIADFPSKELQPYLGTRKYTVKNDTGVDFGPIKDVYRKAGLDDFSAWGPAEPVTMPEELRPRSTETFEFRCSETEPAPITVRYQAYLPQGVGCDYMVEINFQGPGHSQIRSVLKRLVIDERGQLSAAEIPGTATQHTPGTKIVLPPATLLTEGVKLTINSLSGYNFALKRPLETITSQFSNEYPLRNPIKIIYNTPAFDIFVAGAGELRFDIDFTLPPGIEVSSRSVKQTKLMRIDPSEAGVLSVESSSYNGPDLYECSIRYRQKIDLDGIYTGDAFATNDGKSIYLPLMVVRNPPVGEVRQIDVASLVTAGNAGVTGEKLWVFSVPNSIGLLSDRVVSMLGGNTLFLRDLTLAEKKRFTLNGPTAVIAMATSQQQNKIGLLCLKEQNSKYSYTYSRKKISQDQLIDEVDVSLDSVQGISTQNRVPNAPTWVSAYSISQIALSVDGDMAAICIQGGVIVINTPPRQEVEVKVIPIAGAGRPESILVDDRKEIFCAHSQPNNQGLVVSYVKPFNSTSQSVTLPGVVSNMLTDTGPFNTPALKYKRHPAVSLARYAVSGLCVSHGRTIYSMSTREMKVESSITVELPCRLIRAKNDRPPHIDHQGTGASPCTIVYAIGATYIGPGLPLSQFKTHLYKLGLK